MESAVSKILEEDSASLFKLKQQEFTVEIRDKKKLETLNLKRMKLMEFRNQNSEPFQTIYQSNVNPQLSYSL